MKHDFYTSCGSRDCGGGCNLCTLSICKVCRLFEGSLTTDCPGESVSTHIGDKIYSEKLDYRDIEGGWVNKLNPTNQSFLRSKIFDLYRKREGYLTKQEIIIKFGISKEEYSEIEKECLKYLYEGAK